MMELLGIALVCVASVFTTLGIIAMRKLKAIGQPADGFVTMIVMCGCGVMVNSPMLLLNDSNPTFYTDFVWLIMAVAAFTGIIAQVYSSIMYTYFKVSTSIIITNVSIVAVFVFDVWFMGEKFTPVSLSGCLLMFLANMLHVF